MIKKLFKKSSNLIILVAIVVFLLLLQSFILRQTSNIDTKINVYVAATDIPANTLIEEKMIKYEKRDITSTPLGTLKAKEEIIGSFAAQNIYMNEEILKSDIKIYKDNFFYNLHDNENQFMSVAFSSDQANGWRLMKDQYVNIIYSPYQFKEGSEYYQIKIIKSIRIVDILTDNLKSYNINSNIESGIPKYIIFEVSPEIAEFISIAKDKGRLEIVLLSENSLNTQEVHID